MSDDTLTVTIEKLVEGGWGLARDGAEVLLVRGAIPGESVSVMASKRHKGVQKAVVKDVLVASPERVAAPCPVYQACGGCQLQHLRYEAQLSLKREILHETLRRLGKLSIEEIAPLVPSPDPYGYRSTIRFVVFRHGTGFALGFHQEGTNQPVAAAGCLLASAPMLKMIGEVERRLSARQRLPVKLDEVEIRRSVAFGSMLLIFHGAPAVHEQVQALFELFRTVPEVAGQVFTADKARGRPRWVDGHDWIADRLDDVIFRISDRSFMQANWRLTETLVRTIVQWVAPVSGLRVLELYSGIGTLGLPLARRGALVTEVESNPHALADARHAANANHIGRCRFRPLRAEAMLDQVKAGEYDVVLVDPPRAGLSGECLQSLVSIRIPRLLYLSCNASTLARDLGLLSAGGYRVSRVQPFDMFPQTAHLETLVELLN